MIQLPAWLESPIVFFALTLVGAAALWFWLARLIEWLQSPRQPLPGHEDDITTKEELRLGMVSYTVLVLSCTMVVIGIAGAAVYGVWRVPTFNAVVRTSGLVLDVLGVFLLAGSVERSIVAGKDNALFWDQKGWELPGIYLVVTGFLLQAATAFEALQV